jgi:uncharacterized protein (DUF433 family)
MSARIVIDPDVCGGRPIVAGTRICVSDVLDALASSVTVEELLADFPISPAKTSMPAWAMARAVDHTVVTPNNIPVYRS